MRLLSAALALLPAVLGCVADNDDQRSTAPIDTGASDVLVIEPTCPALEYVNLLGARVDGDRLQIDVEHGGGCGAHEYHVCWDGLFDDSSPPRAVLGVRDVTDDTCDALLRRTITVDLDRVKRQYQMDHGPHGRVVIALTKEAMPVYDL
jgi:hypothetical protein